MNDDLEEILGLAKAEAPILPSDAQMGELSVLVRELVEVRNRIEKGEELLKKLKAEELRLSNESVPSKMDEIGFTEVKLPDGRRVSYKPFYSGKIKPESEPEAFNWLEENGHGGIIKGEVIVPWRRADREIIDQLIEFIKDQYGMEPNVKLGVHHSTLRAFFREIIEDEGGSLPPDLFDLFIGRKTTIK